jgi:hypothetical protein
VVEVLQETMAEQQQLAWAVLVLELVEHIVLA